MGSAQYSEVPLDSEEQEYLWSSKGTAVLGLIEHEGQVLLAATQLSAGGIWWQLPGGGTMMGETLPASLRRQLTQEAGLDVSVEDLLYVLEIESYMIFTFRAKLTSIDALSDATIDCCFVPIDQLHTFPRLWGREPLLEWLGDKDQSRRYYGLTGEPMPQ